MMVENFDIKKVLAFIQSKAFDRKVQRAIASETRATWTGDTSLAWCGYEFSRHGSDFRILKFGVEQNLNVVRRAEILKEPAQYGLPYIEYSHISNIVWRVIYGVLREAYPKVPTEYFIGLPIAEDKLQGIVAAHAHELNKRFGNDSRTTLTEPFLRLLDPDVMDFMFNTSVISETARHIHGHRVAPFNGTGNAFRPSVYNVVARDLDVIREALELSPKMTAYWLTIQERLERKRIFSLIPAEEIDQPLLNSVRQMNGRLRRSLGISRDAWRRSLNEDPPVMREFAPHIRRLMGDVILESGATPSKTLVNGINRLWKRWHSPDLLQEMSPIFRALFIESDPRLRKARHTQIDLVAFLEEIYPYARNMSDSHKEIPLQGSLEGYLYDAREHQQEAE